MAETRRMVCESGDVAIARIPAFVCLTVDINGCLDRDSS